MGPAASCATSVVIVQGEQRTWVIQGAVRPQCSHHFQLPSVGRSSQVVPTRLHKGLREGQGPGSTFTHGHLLLQGSCPLQHHESLSPCVCRGFLPIACIFNTLHVFADHAVVLPLPRAHRLCRARRWVWFALRSRGDPSMRTYWRSVSWSPVSARHVLQAFS